MASLTLYNQKGDGVGKYEIDPDEIAPRINKQLLHDVVVMYQSNQRQGSAKTKSRSEVSGTTKKMYRQKGTGNARAGSRRSNIRRGGGRASPSVHKIGRIACRGRRFRRPREWPWPRGSCRAISSCSTI
jgi:ribosomal protein L4